jgi:hypothetical protein
MRGKMMDKKDMYDRMAKKYHTTPEKVYAEMQNAINEAFGNPDPAVREQWRAVKYRGERPTPEELIDYLVDKFNGKLGG